MPINNAETCLPTGCHRAHVKLAELRTLFELPEKKWDNYADEVRNLLAFLQRIGKAGGLDSKEALEGVPSCPNYLLYAAAELAEAPDDFCSSFDQSVHIWDIFGAYIGSSLTNARVPNAEISRLYRIPMGRCLECGTDYTVRAQVITSFDAITKKVTREFRHRLTAEFWETMDVFLSSCVAAATAWDHRESHERLASRPESVEKMVINLLNVWLNLTREEHKAPYWQSLQLKAAESALRLLELVHPSRMNVSTGLNKWILLMNQVRLDVVEVGQRCPWPPGLRNSMREIHHRCQSYLPVVAALPEARGLRALIPYLRGNIAAGDRRSPQPGFEPCEIRAVGIRGANAGVIPAKIVNFCARLRGKRMLVHVADKTSRSISRWKSLSIRFEFPRIESPDAGRLQVDANCKILRQTVTQGTLLLCEIERAIGVDKSTLKQFEAHIKKLARDPARG